MLSGAGIGVVCFASSYAVALALEISRLLFRSGVRGAFMVGFAAAGLVAQTAFLYHQALKTPGSPLSSQRDWCLVAAWLLVVVYLYLTCYHPKNAFGVFLLPLVLGLIGVARFLADAQPYAREPASRAWGVVHGVSILLASVAVLVGFVAGIMYLEQARRLKKKLPPIRGLRLPSLEWLARANSRAIVVSVLMLAVGLASGEILRLLSQGDRLPWYDPVVLSTVCVFLWLLAAAVVGVLYRPAQAGRKVAYLTLVSFVALVVALALVLSVDTQHGGRQSRAEAVDGGR
ncbi:MAG: cytochrome c biogenesis protein CcsA [Planctomycetia bacterium]|nr:cytochrome c biogenesis protein CcsA [Planctomycetia bacterium]